MTTEQLADAIDALIATARTEGLSDEAIADELAYAAAALRED